MATLFKYTAAFMAPILLLLPLWQGRVGWGECLRNLVLFAAFSAWLIFLTPAFEPVDPNIPHLHWKIHTQFIGIPGPLTLWGITRTLLSYLDQGVLFLGWVGVGLLFNRRSREVAFTFAVLLLLAFTSIFAVDSGEIKTIIPTVSRSHHRHSGFHCRTWICGLGKIPLHLVGAS